MSQTTADKRREFKTSVPTCQLEIQAVGLIGGSTLMGLRQLLGARDLPKRLRRVPRYIPADQLDRLMSTVRQPECPYQRTALIVARWSGARRGEIKNLDLDCLDAYPDGTPRPRVPVGKGKTGEVKLLRLVNTMKFLTHG